MKDHFIETKIEQKVIRYFLKSNFVVVNRLFVLVYSNEDVASKKFKSKRYYLTKGIIKNYNVIINGKNFYNQPPDSEEIRKLKTEQGEDYTTVYLLDYEYIKNHYRLIAVYLRRQKELDADPKVIQQVANGNTTDAAGAGQSMFVLTILEKIKETRLNF